MGKSPSSVAREIKRNSVNGDYVSELANQISKKRFWFKNLDFSKRYKEFEKLFLQYFDKRSCGVYPTWIYIKKNFPNVKTPSTRQVFRWIKSNNWVVKFDDRLRKQYKRGRSKNVRMFAKINQLYVKPIWVRPKIIDSRSEFGHWEGDLVVGRQERPYMNIFTLNERKTRMLFIAFIPSKNPWKINSLIKSMVEKNNLYVKSITFDNGLEFEKIGILAKWLNIDIYQCDPYASFQRGSNENLNGIIRRFLPKGENLNKYSKEQLNEIANRINKMPRKMFNGKSSYEMYEKEKAALIAANLKQA